MEDFNIMIDIITDDFKAVSVETNLCVRESIAYYAIRDDSFSAIPLELKNRLAYNGEFFHAVKVFDSKLEQSQSAIVPHKNGWAVRDVGCVVITPKH